MASSDVRPSEVDCCDTSSPIPPGRPEPDQIRAHLVERQWSQLSAALGFDPECHPIPREVLGTWGLSESLVEGLESLDLLATSTGCRVLLVRGTVSYRQFRRAMFAAHRHNPSTCLIWWWVQDETISVATIDRRDDDRRFVRRMETSLTHPDPVGLRQWCALHVDDVAGPDEPDPARRLHRHVVDVLRQESLTREFFQGFSEVLESLAARMQSGPDDEQTRHDIALSTLLRLVFVYFLQQRGALDGDRKFVLRHLRRSQQNGESFYRSVVRPLFFDALNRTPDRRGDKADELGRLPFLNGGLFEPIPAELEHPSIDWPNEVWSSVVGDLLERFHFTMDEGAESDECRAVDPEMLGKVFEGVMYGESRRHSGSFYTPRPVVRRLVERALTGYLTEAAPIDDETARRLLEGEPISLRDDVQHTLIEALRELRLLDPAVGTGAFLLEALHRLHNCYRSLGLDEGTTPTYKHRVALVHRHLFGIDRQQTAVRICELRLWLAILASMPERPIEELPTLPNLAHRIACGNALLAPSDYLELGDSERGRTEPRVSLPRERRRAYRDEMRELHEDFLEAHGSEKAELRRRMESLEREIQSSLLRERRERLEARRAPLETRSDSDDLFGDELELTDEQRRAREAYRDEIEAIDDALEGLRQHRDVRTGFHVGARFGPALEGQGFDVIVTNPPWVRANRLDRSMRKLLETRYDGVFEGLWPGASSLGIRTPFGAQIDMASIFAERCLELLRPGGQLSMLLPSKVFRSLHGSGLRRLISAHDLMHIEDYSDAERDWFDATVYPSALHMARRHDATDNASPTLEDDTANEPLAPPRARRGPADRAPRGQSFQLTRWRGDTSSTCSTRLEDLPALGDHPGEPWVFAPPRVRSAIETMRGHARSLGQCAPLQPSRGVMTGCNRIFVQDEEDLNQWLDAPLSQWTRPVLRGQNIREWSIEADERLLWGYDDSLEPSSDLPDDLQQYVERHAETLRGRSDHTPGAPLWTLFRLKEGVVRPKVVWRDLAPRLEAAFAPADVVPLNTVYFIPFEGRREARLLAALFNSTPLRAVAHVLGERARGGWRRHFAWVMRLLPVPNELQQWLAADRDVSSMSSQLVELLEACESSTSFPPDPDALDRCVAHLFGLEANELQVLRDWQHHVSSARDEEAA